MYYFTLAIESMWVKSLFAHLSIWKNVSEESQKCKDRAQFFYPHLFNKMNEFTLKTVTLQSDCWMGTICYNAPISLLPSPWGECPPQ